MNYCKNRIEKNNTTLCNVNQCLKCSEIQNRKQIVKNLIKLRNSSKKTDNLSELTKLVNQSVTIHKNWLETVNLAVKRKDFSNIGKLDFNEFYHDFENTIKSIYFEIKDKYHKLHFEKHNFNIYTI